MHSITTIEGLSADGTHPLQQAWVEIDVPQCGYCQAGQIMRAAALLEKHPKPTDAQILCRDGPWIFAGVETYVRGARRFIKWRAP